DLVGHLHGPGSEAWRLQLRQVDKLVESIVEGLPPGGLLAVVASMSMSSPSMVTMPWSATTALSDGTEAIGGEVRARHVYTRAGASDDVLAAWRATLGDC
ncbi:alkaline phosphatase family protein, partial [Mycobacterium sp. ITM-2017-0098]